MPTVNLSYSALYTSWYSTYFYSPDVHSSETLIFLAFTFPAEYEIYEICLGSCRESNFKELSTLWARSRAGQYRYHATSKKVCVILKLHFLSTLLWACQLHSTTPTTQKPKQTKSVSVSVALLSNAVIFPIRFVTFKGDPCSLRVFVCLLSSLDELLLFFAVW